MSPLCFISSSQRAAQSNFTGFKKSHTQVKGYGCVLWERPSQASKIKSHVHFQNKLIKWEQKWEHLICPVTQRPTSIFHDFITRLMISVQMPALTDRAGSDAVMRKVKRAASLIWNSCLFIFNVFKCFSCLRVNWCITLSHSWWTV